MKVVAMMRVKNEGRWLAEVLMAIHQVTDQILLFDDHSTDDTRLIATKLGATVLPSPFDGTLDETRDKNYLLDEIRKWKPDFVLSIDGDEVLERGAGDRIKNNLKPAYALYCFPIRYVWNDRQH